MCSILNRLPRQPVFWLSLMVVITVTGLFAVARVLDSPEYTYRWATVHEIGSTNGLSSAAFWLSERHSRIIWNAARLDAPLAYTSLSQTNKAQPLLNYPGITPRIWQTAPASANAYHLIWLDQNEKLYSARLDSEGQTLRGPIELTSEASSFIVLPYSEDRVFVAWIDHNRLFATDIDPAGRPRQLLDPLRDNVSLIAGAVDQESNLHLLWLESGTSDNWAVHYRVTTPENMTLESPETLLAFQTAPDEIITSFTAGLDQSHGYVFWGLARADQPDIERIFSFSFPLDQPTTIQFTELALPAQFEPDAQLPQSDFALGPVAALPPEASVHAALRWPRPATGQHPLLPLALTLRINDVWYPAIVYYQSGSALGYQIIALVPANAAPPTVAIDSAADLHITWAGLQGATPTLFAASTAGQGLIRDTENE